MEIAIFKELTTEDFLQQLEAESAKYEGLYVDMDNKEERKYVKDKAVVINDMLKKLDRARIDKSKAYKKKVEDEAAAIKFRLESANKPFTLLIDEHKAKRAAELAEMKRIEDMKAQAEQYQLDHEEAIMLNRIWDLEAGEREAEKECQKQAQIERESLIAKEAAERAATIERDKIIAEQQRAENERLKREADINHQASVNREALSCLIDNGIDEAAAKEVIKLIAKKQIKNVTINY